MSNFVEDNDLKQLEGIEGYSFSNAVFPGQIHSYDREDTELMKLVLGSLSMKESLEDLKLAEVMLMESRVWMKSDSIQRLRFFIEEFLRRKSPVMTGIAKSLFKYYEDLKKLSARKNCDIKKLNWDTIREGLVRICTDYVPNRLDMGHNDKPKLENFKSYMAWFKAVKEAVDINVLSWDELVRDINQNPVFLEFRGKFKFGTLDLKGIFELCLELDERTKRSHLLNQTYFLNHLYAIFVENQDISKTLVILKDKIKMKNQ